MVAILICSQYFINNSNYHNNLRSLVDSVVIVSVVVVVVSVCFIYVLFIYFIGIGCSLEQAFLLGHHVLDCVFPEVNNNVKS